MRNHRCTRAGNSPRQHGGVAAIAPGMEAFFEANLTPGDYVLACMVTSPDGRAHIEHGMIQQIKVQ